MQRVICEQVGRLLGVGLVQSHGLALLSHVLSSDSTCSTSTTTGATEFLRYGSFRDQEQPCIRSNHLNKARQACSLAS